MQAVPTRSPEGMERKKNSNRKEQCAFLSATQENAVGTNANSYTSATTAGVTPSGIPSKKKRIIPLSH